MAQTWMNLATRPYGVDTEKMYQTMEWRASQEPKPEENALFLALQDPQTQTTVSSPMLQALGSGRKPQSVPPQEAPPPQGMQAVRQLPGGMGFQGGLTPYEQEMKKMLEQSRLDLKSQATSDREMQQAGITETEAALRKYLAERPEALSQLNLSPLLQLTDAWTGSRMAQGYKAPTTEAERELKVAGLRDKLQTQKDRLSDNSMKAKQIDLMTLKEMADLENQQRARMDAKQSEQLGKWRDKLFTAYNADPVTKQANASLVGVDNSRQMLATGKPMSDVAFRTMFATASGQKGAFSDFDIKQYGGSKAVKEAAERIWNKYTSGLEFSENDRKDFNAILQVMEDSNKKALKARAKYYSDSGARRSGFPAQTLMEDLMPGESLQQSAPELSLSGVDAQPVTEDGFQYTPGPGGRGNQANWKQVR
jgi:hypothetical protein